ncbi:MAG: hypothetical protein Q8K70_11290 [Bacteroidota bacterium]|nr:hypothetical protein [Bacteroidota bacterium]
MDEIYEIISGPATEWLKQLGFNIPQKFVLAIIILIGLIFSYFIKKFFFSIKNIISTKKNKSLHPFFNYNEIYSANSNYINQNFQNVAPSKEDELTYTHSSVAKQKLIKFFLNSFSDKSDKRFFILLADSGMGKTTFSLNLYLKYNSFFRYLLKKNKYDISLIPLGYDDADHHLNNLKVNNSHLNTILILDALDEDNKAIINSSNRISELIELTKEFRFVIITCRTQFFNNENLEPNATNIPRLGTKKGYYNFEKLYLSPFSNKDVNRFINKKYGLLKYFHKKKRKSKEIIKKSPYLMARPMLLEFIEDIVDSNKDFNYSFNIYEALIDSWLERETFNVSSNKKFTYKNDLLKFSTEISKKIYDNRKQLGYTISQTKFEEISKKNNLDITSFEMKVRSLLNRNPEGEFKFSHKSILEFFLAKEIYKDRSFKKYFDEDGMDMTMFFYDELCYINNFLPFVSSGKIKTQVMIYTGNILLENIVSKDDLLKVSKIVLNNFNEYDLRAIRCFKNINQLIINNSKIETIDDINSFQNLYELKIQDSKINEFGRISLLSSLVNLYLVNINLVNYQKNEINWKELKNLTYLDLSQNSITDIDGIDNSKNIKTLIISKNNISSINIPSSFEIIDLTNNKLAELNINSLKLKHLNASYNNIEKFKLNKNNSITTIDLSNNPLKFIDIDIQNEVKNLKLANCSLDNQFIKNLITCTRLIELDISGNDISEVNFNDSLNKLEKLNISNTLIKKIEMKNFPKSQKEILISKKVNIEDGMMDFYILDVNGNLIKHRNSF